MNITQSKVPVPVCLAAFTLVELLVVMGIIALVMGILLPSLAASREEAKNVICTTQLDQILKASHVYASTYDDHLPHYGYFATSHRPGQQWWVTQLIDSLNNAVETYVCPSDDNPHQMVQVVRKPGGTLVISDGIEPGRFSLDVTYRGSCDALLSNDDALVGRRITDWDNPSKALLLVEASFEKRDEFDSRECFRFSSDFRFVGTPDWYATEEHAHTWERHRGSSNFLFLDGSVARVKPRDVPAIASEQEFWDSSPTKTR